MNHFKTNLKALYTQNQPLADKLSKRGGGFKNFSLENKNIFDKARQSFIYTSDELETFQISLEKKHRNHDLVFVYGMALVFILKDLSKNHKHIFVFENEIELFALALSYFDLSFELRSSKIILIDSTDKNVYIQLLTLFVHKGVYEYIFLYDIYLSSYYKKFHLDYVKHVNELALNAILVVTRMSNMPKILSNNTITNNLNNIPYMLSNLSLKNLKQERKNKALSAIVVGAGPSLLKQMNLLKQYEKNAVIFCCDGAYRALKKHDIKPDYILSIDHESHILKLIDEINIDSLFMLSSAVCFDITKNLALKNKALSVVLNTSVFSKHFGFDDFGYLDIGTNVAHFAYALAIELNFKNIVAIGQDLSFDENLNSHFSDFAFGEQADTFFCTHLKCQGYYEQEVVTHTAWNDYRVKLEYLFACHKNINFINATEGGAKIANMTQLSFKDCAKFFTKAKPSFNLENIKKNSPSLSSFINTLNKDLELLESFYKDSLNLISLLNKIQENLELEIFEHIFKTVKNFNDLIDKCDYFDDDYFKNTFFQRGEILAKSFDIEDRSLFLFAYLKGYCSWLDIFKDTIKEQVEILLEFKKSYN